MRLGHLNGDANAARKVLPSHIFAMAGPSASHCRCVDAANALSGYPVRRTYSPTRHCQKITAIAFIRSLLHRSIQ
jgi:hypothetical protein